MYLYLLGSILISLTMACASADISTSPTTSPPRDAAAAIAVVRARFPEVAGIRQTDAGLIGASTHITVLDRSDGWDLVFWEGSGDCPAGCINNRYFYFSVTRDGQASKVGEYARIYNATTNVYETSGAPMWGVPGGAP